ncbi:TetR family transcriptional regulator C-terminal domain-containing protein [Williamsia sp. M5A3_1d]
MADIAGLPAGVAARYYRSTDELLIDAFTETHEGLLSRVDQQIEMSGMRDARIETTICDVLTQMLPLSPRRRDEVNLTISFAQLARDHDVFRGHLDTARTDLARRISASLSEGQLCGEVDDDLDCGDAALDVVTRATALATALLTDDDPRSRTKALATVSATVASLCPGGCHHGDPDIDEIDGWP